MSEYTKAQQSILLTQELLRIEQDEDRNNYIEKVLKSSLNERKSLGVTWYPIVIKDSYYGVGDRLIIEIEKPENSKGSHQFQTGGNASLFSNLLNEGIDNPSISGVILSAKPNYIKLSLSAEELPEWTGSGKLGLDLMFDESSYKEMKLAMELVLNASNNRLSELREIILGQNNPSFIQSFIHENLKLNEFQNLAFKKVCQSLDIAIIHGPPGTGKTTTLIEAISETIKKEKQVLVCAPSNNAVDLLTEGLAQKNINVLRIGNPARVNELLLSHTLDYKISMHSDYKQIKDFRKKASEFRVMGMKYKRNFGKEEREQRKLIINEAKKFQIEADKIEDYIIADLIQKAQVISCTLVGCTNKYIKKIRYNSVFIDEAGQAIEPACWIPITRSNRVIMAGDHMQLPPTIKSLDAVKKGLGNTLMEKCISKPETYLTLRTQYRMHEFIMNFSNNEFYNGLLLADDNVKYLSLKNFTGEEIPPLEYIDTAGCGYDEKIDIENQGIYNPSEVELLIKRLKFLLKEIDGQTVKIGIISPYKSQINEIKYNLETDDYFKNFLNISVNTVDGFQGQERDVIFITLVRSNADGQIGFLSDTRRMNVAMTRAKKKLIVIGDSATLGRHKFYLNFINYTEKINAYKSAWEYIYDNE